MSDLKFCIYKQIIDWDFPVNWCLNRNDVFYMVNVEQKINKFYNIVAKEGKNKLRPIHRSGFKEAFLEFAGINFSFNA